MKNKKKLTYLQSQINSLKKNIELLKRENKTLECENAFLHKSNEDMQKNIDYMQSKHANTLQLYKDGLAEIHELRMKYKQLILDANKTKKEYLDKMQLLLKHYHP